MLKPIYTWLNNLYMITEDWKTTTLLKKEREQYSKSDSPGFDEWNRTMEADIMNPLRADRQTRNQSGKEITGWSNFCELMWLDSVHGIRVPVCLSLVHCLDWWDNDVSGSGGGGWVGGGTPDQTRTWTVGGATLQIGPWKHAKPATNHPEKIDRVKRSVATTSETKVSNQSNLQFFLIASPAHLMIILKSDF